MASTTWRRGCPALDVHILHNLAVNHFRKAAVSVHITIDEADQDALELAAVQEQTLLYCDAMLELAGLPDEQRSVLLLVAVEVADVACVLGIPVGTVMSCLSKARERLQQEVESEASALFQTATSLRSFK
jgi:DNA-directed RNA polymerase specialized sigma24 family protein